MAKKRDHKIMITDEAINKVPRVQYKEIPETEYDNREFDTLKSKKVPQSLEIGLFFCQIFIFII